MTAFSLLAPARITARLFGRGVFLGLLTLALSISIMSFLTACICWPNSGPYIRQDDIKPTPIAPSELPVIPPPNAKKDN
jgi:hypothetical protein